MEAGAPVKSRPTVIPRRQRGNPGDVPHDDSGSLAMSGCFPVRNKNRGTVTDRVLFFTKHLQEQKVDPLYWISGSIEYPLILHEPQRRGKNSKGTFLHTAKKP